MAIELVDHRDDDLSVLTLLLLLRAEYKAHFYPHMPIGKVWIYRLLFFCFFFVFILLWISPPRLKLVVSNFARWFIGILGRESPSLGNFAPPEAQNRTNRLRHLRWAAMARACERTTRTMGMCGYTAVRGDGCTCIIVVSCAVCFTCQQQHWNWVIQSCI